MIVGVCLRRRKLYLGIWLLYSKHPLLWRVVLGWEGIHTCCKIQETLNSIYLEIHIKKEGGKKLGYGKIRGGGGSEANLLLTILLLDFSRGVTRKNVTKLTSTSSHATKAAGIQTMSGNSVCNCSTQQLYMYFFCTTVTNKS